MALESGTYINSLVPTNPLGSDDKRFGDDHLRLLKSTLLNTFPNFNGAVVTSHTAFTQLAGVTSNIQAQLDLKAPVESPVLTGNPTVPTPTVSSPIDQVANLNYVNGQALSGTLPSQTGAAGKFLKTDGVNASWSTIVDTAIVKPSVGVKLTTLTAVETLKDKVYTEPIITDGVDETKKAVFVADSVTPGVTATIKAPTSDLLIYTPRHKLLASAYQSDVAQVEVLLNHGYANYVLVFTEINVTAASAAPVALIFARFSIGGVWITTATYTTQYNSNADKAQIFKQGVSYVYGYEGKIELTIGNALTSQIHTVHANGVSYVSAASPIIHNTTVGVLDGVRIFNDATNISAGYALYGVRI